MKKIYFDYAASTPVDPKVFNAMRPYFGVEFGNPGSLHSFGQKAIAGVDRAREIFAQALGTDFRNIIFTGSATEANNLALRGAVKKWRRTHPGERPKIIVSAIEHESVLETARDLEGEGAEVKYLAVTPDGTIDWKSLENNLDERTVIVSVMYANNETGLLLPVARIGRMIRDFRSSAKSAWPLLHTDAVQAFQFLTCRPDELGADLLTLSAQKIYGPKGAGALYIHSKDSLAAVLTGGGQEFGLRSGTESVPAVAGFAKALEMGQECRARETVRIQALAARLWQGIRRIEPRAKLNGVDIKAEGRLPNILNVYFPKRSAEVLLTSLDLKGAAVSAGSACASRSPEPSPVLRALGFGEERAKASIRISLGRPTTLGEVSAFLHIMKSIVKK